MHSVERDRGTQNPGDVIPLESEQLRELFLERLTLRYGRNLY